MIKKQHLDLENIDEKIRSEKLTIEDFANIANELY